MKSPLLLLCGLLCGASAFASDLPKEMPVWRNGTLNNELTSRKSAGLEFGSISELLGTADEVRVLQGFGAKKREFRVKGIAMPQRFALAFAQIPGKSAGLCLCVGDPKVEFYLKGSLLASFSIHHGKSIDYSAGKAFGAFELGEAGVKTLLKLISEIPLHRVGE